MGEAREMFLEAVVDTLVPGDVESQLPSGTSAGIAATLAQHLESSGPDDPLKAALDAVARAGGADAARGADVFVRADAQAREAVLRRVEAEYPTSFRALLLRVLADYYESDNVLEAMGWPSDPPQPKGHALAPFDEALLEPVIRRGRLWR